MQIDEVSAVAEYLGQELRVPIKCYWGTSIYSEERWLLDSEIQLGLLYVFASVLFRECHATIFIRKSWFSRTGVRQVASFNLNDPNSLDELMGLCKSLKRRFWFRRLLSPQLLVARYKQD